MTTLCTYLNNKEYRWRQRRLARRKQRIASALHIGSSHWKVNMAVWQSPSPRTGEDRIEAGQRDHNVLWDTAARDIRRRTAHPVTSTLAGLSKCFRGV
jgi:hypothetical protein